MLLTDAEPRAFFGVDLMDFAVDKYFVTHVFFDLVWYSRWG